MNHKYVLLTNSTGLSACSAKLRTFLFCSAPVFFPLSASISCNSTFSNAGTTTVTSGPVLCHETALGLASNQSAHCLRVWGFYTWFHFSFSGASEGARQASLIIRTDPSLILCFANKALLSYKRKIKKKNTIKFRLNFYWNSIFTAAFYLFLFRVSAHRPPL